MAEALETGIRCALTQVGRLPVDANTLDTDADLYAAGMSSHASVEVMLELEDMFEIEFPGELLNRSVFESIAAIAGAISRLKPQAA